MDHHLIVKNRLIFKTSGQIQGASGQYVFAVNLLQVEEQGP